MHKFFLGIAVMIAFAGCTFSQKKPDHVQRAFYYWKSGFWLESLEDEALDTIGVRKLYVKLFEVERDAYLGNKPTAKTYFNGSSQSRADRMPHCELVPTIFINNDVFLPLSEAGIDSLAANIAFLVDKRFTEDYQENWVYKEMQMDCDWSPKTKDSYFRLLTKLKKITTKTISYTLRLYPYKYRDKMGVPPVDRAMLMCYNLGNPLANPDANSILETKELKEYLGRKSDYPLPLDIALPLYSYVQLYQNGVFKSLIEISESDILPLLKPLKPLWYQVEADTVIGENYLRQGDRIKIETVSAGTLLESARLLSEKVALKEGATIAFFHLDEKAIKKYSYETLDSTFATFSN